MELYRYVILEILEYDMDRPFLQSSGPICVHLTLNSPNEGIGFGGRTIGTSPAIRERGARPGMRS